MLHLMLSWSFHCKEDQEPYKINSQLKISRMRKNFYSLIPYKKSQETGILNEKDGKLRTHASFHINNV